MNKELEALEVLLKDLKHRLLVRKDGDENIQRDYIKIIETALKEYEELDLRVKENNLLIDTFYKVIKKQEQVLKIIKEKELDIGWFKQRFNEGLTYNDYMPQINPKYNLTETEFNLLKEYFK